MLCCMWLILFLCTFRWYRRFHGFVCWCFGHHCLWTLWCNNSQFLKDADREEPTKKASSGYSKATERKSMTRSWDGPLADGVETSMLLHHHWDFPEGESPRWCLRTADDTILIMCVVKPIMYTLCVCAHIVCQLHNMCTLCPCTHHALRTNHATSYMQMNCCLAVANTSNSFKQKKGGTSLLAK